MKAESLYIQKLTYDENTGNEIIGLFPSEANPAIVSSYTYDAKRMGGAPTLTATIYSSEPLQWKKEEFVEFNGDRFFASYTPNSTKDNTSRMWKSEITFTSRRELLDNTLFFDVVVDDVDTQNKDRYRSNQTKFTFGGTIHEFVARINSSMAYCGLYRPTEEYKGYYVVVDEGYGTDEVKEVSFEDQYLTDVLQLVNTTFELDYYWDGNVCHVGKVQHDLTDTPIKYGSSDALISVSKENANYKIVDMITGYGSSDNLPYYYPNDDEFGEAVFNTENISKDKVSVDLSKFLKGSKYNDVLVLYKSKYGQKYSASIDSSLFGLTRNTEPENLTLADNQTNPTVTCSFGFSFYVKLIKGQILDFTKLSFKFSMLDSLTHKDNITEITAAYKDIYLSNGNDIINITKKTVFGDNCKYPCENDGEYKLTIWAEFSYRCRVFINGNGVTDYYGANSWNASFIGNIELLYEPTSEYEWKNGDKYIPYDESGINIREISGANCIEYDYQFFKDDNRYGFNKVYTGTEDNAVKVMVTDRVWIAPSSVLMPSIYRNTKGAERFYYALNNTHKLPSGSGYYEFVNLYKKGNPHQGTVTFDDIKPTINGIVNAEGQLFGEIADVAFDKEDSDVKDSDGNYIHSYFYIKLHKFNGDFGFDLFAHALASESAKINLIKSNGCPACSFVIYKKPSADNSKYYNCVSVDENGNLKQVRTDKNDYIFANASDAYEDNLNQDSTQKELWIAVQKDTSTLCIVMPNASAGFKPQKGDLFVITGIKPPKVLVTAAEKRLDDALVKHMSENNTDQFNYSVKFSRIFLQENPDFASKLNENAKLSIQIQGDSDSDGNLISHEVFVSNYSVKVDNDELAEVEIELVNSLEVTKSDTKQIIDAVKGEAVKSLSSMVGGSNTNSFNASITDKMYLSKLNDDTAKGTITWEKIQKLLSGLLVGNSNSENGGSWTPDTEGRSHLITDYLEVRMKAIFEELVVKKTSTIGGKEIVSPAGGVVAHKVEEVTVTYNNVSQKAYRCYFLAEQEGDAVDNDFAIGDQVRSESFNVRKGTYHKVGNHFYWRLVIGRDEEPVELEGKKYHYIDLSDTDCATASDVPAKGDVLSQCGNRTDVDRQNCLIFSAVDTYSPSVSLYNGINSYSFANKEYVEYGVNKQTNKAFFNVYGDMYVGDRPTKENNYEGSSYIKYDSATKQVSVKGKISAKSTVDGKELSQYIKENSAKGLTEEQVNNLIKNSQVITDLQNQVDGAIETWFYEGVPTLKNAPASSWTTDKDKDTHLGDLYYDNKTGKAYRFAKDGNTYKWTIITDTDIAKALSDASKAQETADGKMKVFSTQPTPPYQVGDIWVNATYPSDGSTYKNEVLRCQTNKAAGSQFAIADWIKASKYTDDTVANAAKKAAEEAQKAAQTAQTNITNLGKTVTTNKKAFDSYVTDGYLEPSEIAAMAQDSKRLEDAFAAAEKSYNEVKGAEVLKSTKELTDLNTAFTTLSTAKKELITYLSDISTRYNAADTNGKATIVSAVGTKFTNFQSAYSAFYDKLGLANAYITSKIYGDLKQNITDLAGYKYIKDALGQTTDIDGGLVMTTLLALRDADGNVQSGINGAIDQNRGKKSIATWWGGRMVDKDYNSGSLTPATSLIRFDGSGYLANGAIWWDVDGKVHADPTSFIISEKNLGAYLTFFEPTWKAGSDGSSIKDLVSLTPQAPFKTLSVSNDLSVEGKLKIGSITLSVVNGALKIDGNVYSTGGMSAYGEGTSNGGGLNGSIVPFDKAKSLTAQNEGTEIASAWSIKKLYDMINSIDVTGQLTDYLKKTEASTLYQPKGNYLTSHQDISGKSDKTHTHSVKINGVTKTIAATGETAVDLGTYLTSHQSLAAYLKSADAEKTYSKLGHTHAFSEITGKPTTLAGYGVTDGVNAVSVTGNGNAVTSASIDGHTLTLTKGSTFSLSGHTHTFASLTSKPTTIAGYGITDAYTKAQVDSTIAKYLPLAGGTITGALTVNGIATFKSKVAIGDIYIINDGSGNLYVQKTDGKTAANFYATGGITAYGAGTSTSGGGGLNASVISYARIIEGSYTDADLTSIPNAYAIKALSSRIDNIATELGGLSLSWNNITGKPSTFAPSAHTHKWAEITDRITKVSQLTNDAGYLTAHQSLASYYTKAEIDAKGYTTNKGTVTSVALTLPTGLTCATKTITTSGTFAISLASGYSIPTTAKQTAWDGAVSAKHTHSNKSVLDGISSTKVSHWNSAYDWYALMTTDEETADGIINKWNEVVSFLANIAQTDTLSGIVDGINKSISDEVARAKKAEGVNASGISANKGSIATLQGYFTNGSAKKALQLTNARKLWGNSFNGTADINGSIIVPSGKYISIGNIKLEYDAANKALKITNTTTEEVANLYTSGGVSAYGVGASSSSGGGLNGSVKAYADAIRLTTENLSEIASAYSVAKLYSEIQNVASAVPSISVSVPTGGNALTGATYDASTGVITFAKGTFLTAHQSLDGYVNAIAVSGSGNAVTAVTKSGKTITFTKGATYLTSHQSLSNYYTKSSVDSLLSGKSATSHTHSVKINGVTKTIAATGGTAVDLGTYLTTHQSLAAYATQNWVKNEATAHNADMVDNYHASGLFTGFSISDVANKVTISIGGTSKALNLVRAFPSGVGNNFNDIATHGNSMGMSDIAAPYASSTANYQTLNGYVNPNGQTGWHHYINLSYTDSNNTATSPNMWQTQFAIKAGTTEVYVRSRAGGKISNDAAWDAPWVRLARVTDNVASASKVANALSWSGYSSGSYNGSAAKSISIPNNTNQLTNGAGFITASASISGNAGSATKLQNSRTINGTSFNGTANIVTSYWGTTRKLWGNSVNGNADVNGSITIANTDGVYVQIGDVRLVYDKANTAIKVVKSDGTTAANFYATGGITAYGEGSGSSGGGGLNGSVKSYADALKLASESLSEIASAYSIKQLSTRITSLEGGSATSISVSGGGNAVTSVTKNGTTISVVKGSTFLTSHQSLSAYLKTENANNTFLKLSGGTISNDLIVNGSIKTTKLYLPSIGDGYIVSGVKDTNGSDFASVNCILKNWNSLGISSYDDIIRIVFNSRAGDIYLRGKLSAASLSGNLSWSYITDRPSSYTPSAHTHKWTEITDRPSSLKNPSALSWSGYSSGSYDGSAAKSISIPNNTNQLTNGAGFITASASITGNAATATKLVTARNIALGHDFRGSANFDGSGNITINGHINSASIRLSSTDPNPFKRIAHVQTAYSWKDNALLLYLSQGYIDGNVGICRVEFRTNNVTKTGSAGVNVRWLVRYGYATDSVQVGYYSAKGNSYMDVFVKTTGGYQGTVIRCLQDSRGDINSNVSLFAATQTTEAYTSIEAAATALYNLAYTSIVNGSDVGTVNYANSAGNSDTLDGIHANGLFTNLSNSGNNLSITIGGTHKTLTVKYAASAGNADTLDGVHASGLFTNLSNSGNNISITIGGTNKTLTAAYATNCDTVDGYHAGTSVKPYGTIPVIGTNGVIELGHYIDFHHDNTTGSDYSVRLQTNGNHSNVVTLPTATGTLALTSDNVASATKLQTTRTLWGQSFNGTANISGSMTGVGDMTLDAGARIKHGSGNLYIGNSDNSNWIGVQDICSQSSIGDDNWSLRTSGAAHFKDTTINGTATIKNLLSLVDGSHKGLKMGSTYISSLDGEVILQGNTALRFGNDAWDYNQWAGLKYDHSIKTVYLGIADGSIFNANSAQSGGVINLKQGISSVYTPTLYAGGDIFHTGTYRMLWKNSKASKYLNVMNISQDDNGILTIGYGNFSNNKNVVLEGYNLNFRVGNDSGMKSMWLNYNNGNLVLSLDGNFYATGGVTAYKSSDERLKHDIHGVDSLAIIKAMGGTVAFRYNADNKDSIGWIAQRVLHNTFMQDLVEKDDKGFLKINYWSPKLIAVAFGAIEQVDDEVSRLKARVVFLESEVQRLSGKQGSSDKKRLDNKNINLLN